MIQPLGDFALILPDPEEGEHTVGGIILPKAQEQQLRSATVVAVGPGRTTDDGKTVPLPVKVGDRIVLSRATGLSVYVGNEKHLMVPGGQILGIIGT